MHIVSLAVQRILYEIKIHEKGDSEGRANHAGWFILSPELERAIHEMRPRIAEIEEEGEEILGVYRCMLSPGQIVLYWQKIGSFFWQTAYRLAVQGYSLNSWQDLERLAYATVWKTYYHERFHHYCDVCNHLWGITYNFDQEEALAVAFSYHTLQACFADKRYFISSLDPDIWSAVIDLVYQYRGRGYRDWVNFRDRKDFKAGCTDYSGPLTTDFLEESKVNVGDILAAIRGVTSGSEVGEILDP